MKIKVTYDYGGEEAQSFGSLGPSQTLTIKSDPPKETDAGFILDGIDVYDGTNVRQHLKRVIVEVVS